MRTSTVGPVAVLEDADDAVAADLFGHLEAKGFQLLGQAGRRLLLLERQLGVGVQVLVKGVERLVFGVDLFADGGGTFLEGIARGRFGLGRCPGSENERQGAYGHADQPGESWGKDTHFGISSALVEAGGERGA